jgi:hypothetical protein
MMVFERRAYTFRPGMIETFWKAQAEWNTPEVYGVVLDHNLSYFSTVAGPSDQIIQLYRFNSLDHWRSCYETYYATQNPEYFRLVRTCMLQQENGFFIAPPAPVADLAKHLATSPPTLPAGVEAAAAIDVANMCITETILDLLPGGLPAYWAACAKHGVIDHPIDAPHRVATLFTLVGRVHRVIQYRGFASIAEAQAHRARLDADPAWQAFVADHQSWVAGSLTHFLKPAPWPRMRTLWGRGR